MIIIGEKINGSIPSVAKAIAERDSEFIKERARKQADANATYIPYCIICAHVFHYEHVVC